MKKLVKESLYEDWWDTLSKGIHDEESTFKGFKEEGSEEEKSSVDEPDINEPDEPNENDVIFKPNELCFKVTIDDGNHIPFIWGEGDSIAFIQPKNNMPYDQSFKVDNDDFNKLFDEEMECTWSTKMSKISAIDFLLKIGMKKM
jgi:hypothetical protein